MVDAVHQQVIQDGDRYAIMLFTNISDGTGEVGVTKVDVSALNPLSNDGRPCTSVRIEAVWFSLSGMQVIIIWDGTVPNIAWITTSLASQHHDFTIFGGLTNDAGVGRNGNITFTTIGAAADDTYTIVLKMIKQYN